MAQNKSIARIVDLGKMPDHGKIRAGVKSGKAMKSIETWRLTSPDEGAIIELAERYGGRPVAWSDPKASPRNQFEVITESTRLEVYLVPDPIDQAYELFGGKGMERRCDGETVELSRPGRDGPERVEQACVCAARGEKECRLQTRLRVIFPGIPFGGAWVYATKSEVFAAHELVAMAEFISGIQQKQGMTPVWLDLEKHNTPGHNFVLGKLRLQNSVDEVLAGKAIVGASIGTGATEMHALEAGESADEDLYVDGDTGWMENGRGEAVDVVAGPMGEAAGDMVSGNGTMDEITDAEVVDDTDKPSGFDSRVEAQRAADALGMKVERNQGSGKKWVVVSP